MKVSIRAATLDDLEILVHHRVSMFRDMGIPEHEIAAVEGPAREYFRRTVPAGRYRGFLGETEEGRVVSGGGVVIMDWPAHPREPRDSKAMILNMYTEREFRRQGIARRVMQAMIDWCRDNGYRTVALHASSEGRPLYASLGFEPSNEMRLLL